VSVVQTVSADADLECARFVVEYVGSDGALAKEPLGSCAVAGFEGVPAVRSFRFSKGMRSFAGWWWFASTGEHVGYESWLERDHLMLMDFDPSVVAVASQPFWLCWHDGSRRRRHAPDFFARRADGTGVVVDVRADDQIPEHDAEVFAVTARACAEVGWEFRRVGVPGTVLTNNVRWLSRYRHPRCRAGQGSGLDTDLLDVFRVATPLFAGANAVGDRLRVLPVLFHLMWLGRLITPDFGSAPLAASTLVRTAAVS
jgi:hypothetical protein